MKNFKRIKFFLIVLLGSIFIAITFISFNDKIFSYAYEQSKNDGETIIGVVPHKYCGYGCSNANEVEGNLFNITVNYKLESPSGFGCGASCGTSREDGYSPMYASGCKNWQVMPIISPLFKYWIDESTLSSLSDVQKNEFICSVDKAAFEWNNVRIADYSGAIVNLQRQSQNGADIVPIRYDPALSDGLLGEFNPVPLFHEIKIKRYNDYDTILHEFGHMIGLQDLDMNNSSYTHISLMGYAGDDLLHYQDIQGLAVANEKHSFHDFRRYWFDGVNYNYVCYFCDITDSVTELKEDIPHLEAAVTCVHQYEELVSATNRYWFKCSKCYKVIESDYIVKVKPDLTVELCEIIDAPESRLIIPNQIGGRTVTSIGSNLFINQKQIISVTMSNSITNIGDGAFMGCTNLLSASLSNEITSIGVNAFAGCVGLVSINIPTSIISIGAGAFSDCLSLKNVILPTDITDIGAEAFLGCSSLTYIFIPEGTTSVGAGAFGGCYNLNIAVSGNNPNYLADGNILYNKEKSIINSAGNISNTIAIPITVTDILPYAFYGNTNLEILHIYGAPTIGMFAFEGCGNMTKVYCYSYETPAVGVNSFVNDDFVLYTPHSKQSVYVTAFAGYVDTASSISVTISFSSDGIIVDTLDTYFGANIIELTNPSKTGYSFIGWYDDSAFTGAAYVIGGVWDTFNDITVYAKWAPRTYYIYFTGYGSENLADKEVIYDKLIGELPYISKKGYTFYGWKNQYNEYFTSDMIWQKLSNQTVFPDFRANQYTITYNGNGGTVNAQNQLVYYDSVVASFATAYRDGYTFTGWNTSADGSGETFLAPYTYLFDEDTTLYAQYTANEYNITFDKQGGTGGSNGVNATYNEPMPNGISITAPTKDGYSFQGYFRYANGVGTKYYNADMTSANNWNLSDDTTLFAYWAANQYMVILNHQGGIGGTGSVYATYNLDMPSGQNITAPTRAGYTFQGYYRYVNGVGTKYYSSDMRSYNVWNETADCTIYAYWKPNIYTVILQKEGGTGGSDSVNATYLANMPSAVAPTRVGYAFQGYYSLANGLGTKYYNADMSSSHAWNIEDNGTLYAYWVGNKYTVTFNKQGGSGGTNSIVATYGANMPTLGVSAPTRRGYIFKGYYEYANANGTKYYDGPNLTSVHTLDKASDITLYAYWEQEEYTITLFLYDGMTDSTTIHYGDHVQVDSAPTRHHYEFKGYYSGQNGTGICYVRGVLSQMYGDLFTIEPESTSYTWNTYGGGTLYAYWELFDIDYSYSVIVENEGYLPDRAIRIVSGASTILNAPVIEGYTFKGWNANGRVLANGSTYDFELHRSYVTGEVTIYYYWGGSAAYSDGSLHIVYTKNPSCVAAGTMITLADGTQKQVELLTGNEMLLVWNMYTGQFDSAPILFIDHDSYALYKIINLYFSDGTVVKVIDEHAFWDINLNRYVFLRHDAAQYIGHWFNKQTYDISNNIIWTSVQLTKVVLTEEYTTAWSPVTYGHLCLYVNGMLSMPGATTGLINIFEVDDKTMTINQAKFIEDIATYGVFTYQEFAQLFDISEDVFNAFNGQYLKVSIGKGFLDYNTIECLIERYSSFFD